MLKIDFSVIIQIANFLLLLFLLNVVLYRPIRRILGQRAEEMNRLGIAAGDCRSKAVHCAGQLEEGMSGARRQGFKEKEEIKAKGLALEKKMYQEAGLSASEKVEGAKAEIERKTGEVRQSLMGEVDQFSRELAERILGRSV